MLGKLGTRTPLYLRLYLSWSGQVQVRYVVSTTYYLLPTTYYRLPTTDYRLPTTGKALIGRRALSCQEQRRLNACRKVHAYNAYREEHLSAYKMDVRDYFGSQKTLVFSGKREIIPTGWVQLKDKKDELRRCCHSYSATWPPAPSTLPVEPPLIGLQMSSMVSTRTRLR